MVINKEELIGALGYEVQVLQHLISKIDPAQLGYRPSPKQWSTLELLQTLTMIGPIHLRSLLEGKTDMAAMEQEWKAADETAKKLDFDGVKAAIAELPAYYASQLAPLDDAAFRTPLEIFGEKLSRGSWLVGMVLSRHSAYRMQLFLYLKASGRPELNSMNLWSGRDS